MEENKNENEIEDLEESFEDDEEESGTLGQWLKDNMRIIISILIVVAIAGGVYSFSKRADAPKEKGKTAGVETKKDSGEKSEEIALEEKTDAKEAVAEAAKDEQISSASTSQETETSFVETAGKGDGTTRLARRALANYLEKNSDSSLTAEHKVYIEDYLRKQIGKKKVGIGTSVEFSKDNIQKAVEQSKNLNEKQLQNLHKYAVLVPSLS